MKAGRVTTKRAVLAALVGAAAVSLCAAIGSTTSAQAGAPAATQPRVSPESCLACVRAADWKACHETALSLAMEHEWPRAIAIEEMVHRAQPMNAEVAAVLARLYQEGTRNTARAFELYHEAMSIAPGYPPAILGLGTMMQDLGSLDVAERYFRRGAQEKPDEPMFKARLAEVLVRSGHEEEARPFLDEIVQRWPGSREAEQARRLMPSTSLARP